jgi:hypothetical protein
MSRHKPSVHICGGHFAFGSQHLDVRYGSLADIRRAARKVRFVPEADVGAIRPVGIATSLTPGDASIHFRKKSCSVAYATAPI